MSEIDDCQRLPISGWAARRQALDGGVSCIPKQTTNALNGAVHTSIAAAESKSQMAAGLELELSLRCDRSPVPRFASGIELIPQCLLGDQRWHVVPYVRLFQRWSTTCSARPSCALVLQFPVGGANVSSPLG